MADQDKKAVIHIHPVENKMRIDWQFWVRYMAIEETNTLACYIEGFDIHFYAIDKPSMDKKAVALTDMFFDYFLDDDKKGIKPLVLELHKKGFKTKNDTLDMKRILKDNKIGDTKFNLQPRNIPEAFIAAQSSKQENNKLLALA